MTTFGDRIKLLREFKGLTQAELGDLLAKAENTIWSWENNKNKPHINFYRVIAEKCIASEQWLRTGEGNMLMEPTPVKKLNESPSEYKSDTSDSVTINVMTLAGVGNTHDEEHWKPIEQIQLSRSEVTVDGKILTQAVKAEGDSMYPTIVDKGLVGVDFEDKKIVNNGIYLIRFPDLGIAIKRLQLRTTGLLIESDNMQVKSEEVDKTIVEQGFVLGRVRWIHNKV